MSYNILIVDDVAVNSYLLKETIEDIVPSAKVTCVEDGKEALKVLELFKYDLIFMDLMMPNLDGKTATEIAKSKMGIDTPIIAVTGSDCKKLREKWQLLFDGFIEKPIDLKELTAFTKLFLNL